MSDGTFTILPVSGGRVPTTLRDVELAGTQPFRGAVLNQPQDCATGHGNYHAANEPWQTWRGSMMAQAMRDPLFLACLAVAEQDAPSVGDLCLRCHTPGGWQEGRSTDTSGGMINANDREGIQCDFCHRAVDRNYVADVSPAQDVSVLAALDELPLQYGNGQFINDPAPLRRGPFADAQASHDFVESPFQARGFEQAPGLLAFYDTMANYKWSGRAVRIILLTFLLRISRRSCFVGLPVLT